MGAIDLLFVEEGAQTAESVTRGLADLVRTAKLSLDLAIYDCHLEGESADLFAGALRDRRRAGVALRVIHNAQRPPATEGPTIYPGRPDRTEQFFAAHGIEARPVGDAGTRLMHHKYLVVDAGTRAAKVWTGSANITTDSFTRQENNVLTIASPALASAYTEDFEDLWATSEVSGSGARSRRATVRYQGEEAYVEVRFAPGEGGVIDAEVADRVRRARREVSLAAFVVSSGHVLGALRDAAERGVHVTGVVDLSLMTALLEHWRTSPVSGWKADAFAALSEGGRIHGKHSGRGGMSGPHDFLHDKVLVVDDTVITGSYNYSGDAELNAENILFIEGRALADAYRAHVRRLMARYPAITSPA